MKDKNAEGFDVEIRKLLDSYVHAVYDATLKFPKEEIFGITSQLRRAAMSAVLNYVEGYARRRDAVLKNFIEIAYGSLKESEYLINFSLKRGFIDKTKASDLARLADRIGAMFWGILKKLE